MTESEALHRLLSEKEINTIYMCLRRCQGTYYTEGALPFINISIVDRLLNNQFRNVDAPRSDD